MNRLLKVTVLSTLLVAPLIGLANPGERGGADRPPGPSPEAIAACDSLSEADTCSFAGRHDEEVFGTCEAGPEPELPLACRPAKRERPSRD